jgi:hypothetical protein
MREALLSLSRTAIPAWSLMLDTKWQNFSSEKCIQHQLATLLDLPKKKKLNGATFVVICMDLQKILRPAVNLKKYLIAICSYLLFSKKIKRFNIGNSSWDISYLQAH